MTNASLRDKTDFLFPSELLRFPVRRSLQLGDQGIQNAKPKSMFDLVTKTDLAVAGKKCGLGFVTWHFISAISYCIDAVMVSVAVSSGGNYPLVLAVGLVINFVTFMVTLLVYDWFQQT